MRRASLLGFLYSLIFLSAEFACAQIDAVRGDLRD